MKRTGFLTIAMLLLTGIPALAQSVSKDGKDLLNQDLLKKQAMNAKVTSSLANLSGTWWRTPLYAKAFDLTADQQKRMDDVFQESRVRLIALDADLKVQEATLEPLMSAERMDEAKTLAQIDRVAQARAELEKANARMLLRLRMVLTSEQWDKIQTLQQFGFKAKGAKFPMTK